MLSVSSGFSIRSHKHGNCRCPEFLHRCFRVPKSLVETRERKERERERERESPVTFSDPVTEVMEHHFHHIHCGDKLPKFKR